MSAMHIVGHLSDIPVGEGRNVVVDGLRLAVFRLRGDDVFVTQAECPHRQGPLADGLTGTGGGTGTVMCPLHDRVFDLRTGLGVNTECRLATYPSTVGPDGAISIALEPGAPGTQAGTGAGTGAAMQTGFPVGTRADGALPA